MARPNASGGAVLLTLLGLLLLAPGASAAETTAGASIDHVEAKGDGLRILVSAPAGVEVDLDRVEVEVAGAEAAATASRVEGTTAIRRTAVLVIDTSNSMRGARFTSAKEAARTFVDAVPEDVHLGVVGFAGQVTTYLSPTRDRGRALEVLDSLTLSQGTLLYDGVIEAVDVAGEEGQRTLLVLSDGADTSRTELGEATDAVTEAGVLADVVSLDDSAQGRPALEALAGAGDGLLIPADPAALQAAFSAEADVLARQLLVSAEVPGGVPAEGTIRVTLPTDGDPVVAEVFAPLRQEGARGTTPQAPRVPVADSTPLLPSWAVYGGPAALGLGLLATLLLLLPRRQGPITVEQAVSRYTSAAPVGAAASGPSGGHRMDTDQALATAKGTAASVLRHSGGLDARISRRLEAAGSELKSAEWLLVHVGVVILAGLLGVLIGGGSILVGLLFLVLGLIGPWLYLGVRGARRRKAFGRMLPDILQLMSGSLAAGLSVAQSIDTIVREGAEPTSGEFRRVLVETRLGVPLEDALDGVGERFRSDDFKWVVMAIRIQRQVGGNLAELLDSVADTMREREYIRRQVSALAAEGKLSAWVLGCLPPAFMVYLTLASRDYVGVMYTDPRGWIMLAFAVLWLGIGVFWMSRMVKVEV